MNRMIVESLELTDRMREEATAEKKRIMRPPQPIAAEASRSKAKLPRRYADCSGRSSPETSWRSTNNAIPERSSFSGGVDRAVGEEPELQPGSHTVHIEVDAHNNASDPDDVGDDSSGEEDGVDWEDPVEEANVVVAALEEATTTPLFEGSNHSSMGTTYNLLGRGKLNGCSDTYMDELSRTLSTSIFPQPNSLPKSYIEASEYLKRLGHSYVSYDVCPNNCRLFRGDLKLARVCPECRASRKRWAGRSEVPHKVTRVFPLTPHLKRMFRSLMQATSMTWWASLVAHLSMKSARNTMGTRGTPGTPWSDTRDLWRRW